MVTWFTLGQDVPILVDSHRAGEYRKLPQKKSEDKSPNQRQDKPADEALPTLFGLKKALNYKFGIKRKIITFLIVTERLVRGC